MKWCLRKILFFFLTLFLIINNAHARFQQHGKLWNQAIIIGPISPFNEKRKYYLDGRLKLMDDKYKFEQARIYYGIGYQITKDFGIYIGGAYVDSENPQGVIAHENRIWQQISWDFLKKNTFTLSDRTRFEERKNTQFSQWAWRLREQVMLRIPLKFWDKHALRLYDEMFINFNQPSWVSNRFIAENRIYIGIETTINKVTSLDVGYMNQYHFDRNLIQRSNILTLTLNIKC